MKYEELSTLWNQDSDELESISINKRLLREVSFSTIRNNLKEIKWSSYIEIIINYLWIAFLIEFIMDFYPVTSYLVPAGILLFIAVYSVIFETYKLVVYYSINNRLSIVKTQKRLEQLRRMEIFDTNSLYFFMPIFFIPFVIVAARGFLGIDVYDLGLSEREMLFGTLGTLVVSLIIIFFLKRYPNKELIDSLDFVRDLKSIEDED